MKSIVIPVFLFLFLVGTFIYAKPVRRYLSIHRAVSKELVLRILPLGDSITNGSRSTHGNGYRLDLFNNLGGYMVNYIGSESGDGFPGDYHEGHDGYTIDQISGKATRSLRLRPNVVLLHAGTNDLGIKVDPADAPQRLATLLDKIVQACPDALVLVATVIPSRQSQIESRIETYNKPITSIVSQRASAIHHVALVDMFDAVAISDLADDFHPNDDGYKKMADQWRWAIDQADTKGWINKPIINTSLERHLVNCNYKSTWTLMGRIFNETGLAHDLDAAPTCTVSLNDTSACECDEGSGLKKTRFNNGRVCASLSRSATTAVHFADLNGDGRAEYLWVDANGSVTAYLNDDTFSRDDKNGKNIHWSPRGIIASSLGASGGEVQFADLNGDGRAEYLQVFSNGSVKAWLNTPAPNSDPAALNITWLPLGLITHGPGQDGEGVRFADLDGDGRADYIWISPTTSIHTSLNTGGPPFGFLPLVQTAVGSSSSNRAEIAFVDINGDGRADFLALSPPPKLGSRDEGGGVQAYLNFPGDNDGDGDGDGKGIFWAPQGEVWAGAGVGMGRDGRVYFADLDGDGRAEVLMVGSGWGKGVWAWRNSCDGGG